MTSDAVEKLEWDSSFFGRSIGRARSSDLGEIVLSATRQSLNCVYIETTTALPTDPRPHTLVPVEERVRLRREPGGQGAERAGIRVEPSHDTTGLGPLVELLVPWSRFSRDERFGPSDARRMYVAWLERAAKDDEESLGVARLEAEACGFVTVAHRTPQEIGLIASTEPGAGRAMLEWASGRWPGRIEVVTQGDNAQALAFYARLGFSELARTFMYHLWLEPEA